MEWIRAKDLPIVYPIGRSYAYELLQQFKAESDGYIKDGKVLLVKKEDFERWWKEHGERKDQRKQRA